MKTPIKPLTSILALVFLLFNSFAITSQSQKVVDSIKNVLRTTTSDSVKYINYGILSKEYAMTMVKKDTALMYADSIQLLAVKNDDKAIRAAAYFHYGFIDRVSGDYDKAIEKIRKFVNFHEESGGIELAKGLFQIGVMQLQSGSYEEALFDLQRAHEIYKDLGIKKSKASTENAMAVIFRRINKYDDAIRYFENAINTRKELKDSIGLSQSIEALGNTYGQLENYSEAEKYLKQALAISRSQNRLLGMASINENLGVLYNKMNLHTKALVYQKEALNLRKKMSNKRGLALANLKIGNTYSALGNIDLSERHLVKSFELAKAIKNTSLITRVYKAMAELYYKSGDTKNAYENLKLYGNLKDSLFNEEKNRQLVEMETKYDVKQKEQAIQLLAKENELQLAKTEKESAIKNGLLVGMLLLAIIAGLIFYALRQRLKNQSILAKKNEELRFSQFKEQLSTLEMKALRAQMNPHFLFNCMNSINRMILGNQNDEASSYLAKFSKLVRAMLENSEQAQVSLKQELQLLKSYIQLESIRFKNKIDSEIIVDENIHQDDTYIPSMLLQPFVENAIWHGLMHKTGKGKISLHIEERNDMLHCEITDNGIGRKRSMELQKENRNDKKSMGIKITTNRLAMLTKKKMDELVQIIDLKDDENNATGTKVQIAIPIL